MAEKRNVKNIIKIGLFFIGILAISYIENSITQNQQPIKNKTSKLKQEASKTTSKKTNKCAKLIKEVRKKYNSQHPVFHWKNYYLSKDGIEYVLRVERAENNNGIETDFINYYQLDSEGLPTLIKKHSRIPLKEHNQIDKILKGHKILELVHTESFQDGNIIIERSGNKLIKIQNNTDQLSCIIN